MKISTSERGEGGGGIEVADYESFLKTSKFEMAGTL